MAARPNATNITEFSPLIANGGPTGIAAGPDGNLWFTEYYGNRIARLNIELAPLVATGAASSIGSSGARLAGKVTPLGARTSYALEYGLTSAYGSVANPLSQQILPAGAKPVAVSSHRATGLRRHGRNPRGRHHRARHQQDRGRAPQLEPRPRDQIAIF